MSNFYLNDLPYTTEYAKSGRAQCRWCRDKIGKGELRLAAMVQSKHHEGKDPFWYHHKCFFSKYRYLTVQEISNFNSLQLEDQELIKKYLGGGVRVSDKENLQKSGIHGLVNSGEFHVGYAKSNLSRCVSCEGRIAKDEVRVSQLDYTSERALLIPGGKMDRWHHVECFVANREKLEFHRNVVTLPGFYSLKLSDQENLVARCWGSTAQGKENSDQMNVGSGIKTDRPSNNISISSDKKGFKEQEELIASFKVALTKHLRDKDMLSQVLMSNNQDVPVGVERMLERVSDIMAFGALERCQVCKGQLEYKNGVGYQCLGYINLHTKCVRIVKEPIRLPFQIPEDLKTNPTFQTYEYISRSRIIPVQEKSTDTDEPPRKLPKIDKTPLLNLKFLISDRILHEALRIHLKNQIERYGGKVMDKISKSITAIISVPDEVKKMTKRMIFAKNSCIPVISADFANSITEVNFIFTDLVKKHLICDWILYSNSNSRPALQNRDASNRPESSKVNKSSDLASQYF